MTKQSSINSLGSMRQYATFHDLIYGSKPTIYDLSCWVVYRKCTIYDGSYMRLYATSRRFSHLNGRVAGFYLKVNIFHLLSNRRFRQGVVHKWRHVIFDNLWHPLPPLSRFLVLRLYNCHHKILDTPPLRPWRHLWTVPKWKYILSKFHLNISSLSFVVKFELEKKYFFLGLFRISKFER